MNRDTLAHTLSGGYIERHAFDIEKRLFLMNVHVLENGVLSTYDVRFQGISLFSFTDNQAGEWERIQLTELWIDAKPEESGTEEWEVTMSLWDLAHLKLRCSNITIDDDSLR